MKGPANVKEELVTGTTLTIGRKKERAGRGSPTFFRSVWAIVWKDLMIEWRTRQTLAVMLVFALTVVVVFSFALGSVALTPGSTTAQDAAVGFLWATILLAGTLGLNRSLMSEQENRSLEALLMAPVDRSAIYLGKVLSVNLFTLLMLAVIMPVFIVFFNQPLWQPPIIMILILGVIGYVAAGVLVTSMSMQTRMREVLLPVLLLPLTLPSVLAAATAVSAYLAPQPPAWDQVQFPIAVVITFDILMLTVGFLTYQYVVEE
jgi:heme exporter protein B